MRLSTVAAAFATASLSLVSFPTFAAPTQVTGHRMESDPIPSGGEDLEIDITWAGNTQPEVQKFLASLEPNTRQLVLAGCRHYLKVPAQAQDTTILFCLLAIQSSNSEIRSPLTFADQANVRLEEPPANI